MLTDEKIQQVVSRVLRERFGASGLLNSDVIADEDYDGIPILRVLAHFDRPVANVNDLVRAVDAIRAELLKMGEDRYVFLTHDYPQPDDELDEDDDITTRAAHR